MTTRFGHVFAVVFSLSAVLAAAGCGNGTLSTPQREQLTNASIDTRAPGLAAGCPCLYVVNDASVGALTVYASGANGDAKPLQNIAGSDTGLRTPEGVAVDGNGNMYVANRGTNTITVYAAGSTGNVAPIQTISGSLTGLNSPRGIALDPVTGNIYVANWGGGAKGSLTAYAATSNGNVAPSQTIAGSNTGLDEPLGLALDANGNVDVPNYGNKTVTVYAAGATGNVKPTQTIEGKKTALDQAAQVAVDTTANTYVINLGSAAVTVYASGATGNVAPMRTLKGKLTKMESPDGIGLDGSGNVYVANSSTSTITVYGPKSKGNAKPIRTITGADTGLAGPGGVAIR
jgi:6-phosphogluconolactonase (cycloisomerase 2 family)